jgi:hypothetical protein
MACRDLAAALERIEQLEAADVVSDGRRPLRARSTSGYGAVDTASDTASRQTQG